MQFFGAVGRLPWYSSEELEFVVHSRQSDLNYHRLCLDRCVKDMPIPSWSGQKHDDGALRSGGLLSFYQGQ